MVLKKTLTQGGGHRGLIAPSSPRRHGDGQAEKGGTQPPCRVGVCECDAKHDHI